MRRTGGGEEREERETHSDHGNSDRPRRIPDRELQVGVVRFQVLAHLHVVRDLGNVHQHVRFQFLCQ
jgi:hypothetical protein